MFVWLGIYKESSFVKAIPADSGYRVGYSFIFLCLAWPMSAISLLWFCFTNTLCNCRIYVNYAGAR